jgi:hypothetical protein
MPSNELLEHQRRGAVRKVIVLRNSILMVPWDGIGEAEIVVMRVILGVDWMDS